MTTDKVPWENSLPRSIEQKPAEKWMRKKSFYRRANYLLWAVP